MIDLRGHALVLILLPLVVGCGLFEKDMERKAIAEAKDHVLYSDELLSAMPTGLNAADSALFAQNYVQQWAMQRFLLDRAELNLSEEQKDVSNQLDEYRRSLIIYLYQTEWVRQQMDTVVNDASIDAYFEANKDDFELQEDIVQALFLKFEKQTNNLKNVSKWMQSDDEELRTMLEDLAMEHASAIHLNDKQWIPLANLRKQIPSEHNLTKGLFEYQDSTSHYFVFVKELKQKNTSAPVAYIRSNIANIILNKRKLEMVKKLEKDIFNEAVGKNQFKVLKD